MTKPPSELIRSLQLGLPIPADLHTRFPAALLEQWRLDWCAGPGLEISAQRDAALRRYADGLAKASAERRAEQAEYWIEPGSMVRINMPRTSKDQRTARLLNVEWNDGDRLMGQIHLDMTTVTIPMESLVLERPFLG